jgi:hypothetical protein
MSAVSEYAGQAGSPEPLRLPVDAKLIQYDDIVSESFSAD